MQYPDKVQDALDTLRNGVAAVDDLAALAEPIKLHLERVKARVAKARKNKAAAKTAWERWLAENAGNVPEYQAFVEATDSRAAAGHYRPLETALETITDEARRRAAAGV